MSIKLELDANSIKQAISNHIAAQGFNLDGKKVEVALVNGRGGNGNRATITISDDKSIIVAPTKARQGILREMGVADEAPAEILEIDLPIVDVEETVIMPVISQGEMEVIIPDLDPIIAAAEHSADPFGAEDDGMEDFFPKTNPSDVETPKSLF